MATSATSTGTILVAARQAWFRGTSRAGAVEDGELEESEAGVGDETWAVTEPDPGDFAEFHEPLEEGEVRDESVSRFSRFKSPRNSAAVW